MATADCGLHVFQLVGNLRFTYGSRCDLGIRDLPRSESRAGSQRSHRHTPVRIRGVSGVGGWRRALVLTFLTGCVYCCMESGCHLRLFSTKRWEWLRRRLSACGIQLPSRLTLMVEVVVEEDAIFFDYSRPDPTRRGRYAFAPVASQRYHHVVEEAAL